jgi:hypothetical protein
MSEFKEFLNEKVKWGDYPTDEAYFAEAIRQGLTGNENIKVDKLPSDPGKMHLVTGVFTTISEDGKRINNKFKININDLNFQY